MKEKMQKISKFIVSRMFYLILGISVAIAIPIAYAAWNSTVNPGETLTATKWNEHVNKLIELSNKIDSWPPGSYCIFMGGGSCPSGFAQKSGYMRAIFLFAADNNYIVPVTFGNSNIQCHGACGQYGNWIGELNLNICCK
ncbi:hypothetical protein KKD20_02440 [Patescibacteria group bacterium]|nr:hypothetical protein [Patescibacteria group bacterium]MBU4455648.1 hypothetical protein [Patescibacteria group bacterium]MCG2690572.1 hypothetical protein [Candidatus Parcubacteria bacterium]